MQKARRKFEILEIETTLSNEQRARMREAQHQLENMNIAMENSEVFGGDSDVKTR